ncbi:NAD-dependent epimerase/dehydratase family protein [Aquimarina sp. TRL1]|uniref:NAD-dependent epimerase/dehydratase family protein n=1 Tax=Aquimarina sp. (strain TRL1) TaxID=2736252 RepID=UPI00158F0532|nr:NAD-dependent epimerase/dehydratase family protein [Aquimarina sp. TRL1]QKX04423.1 NAD-dependent epimerase/dehydratase family protein [Aquimarina sp. TRL1]
MILVTGATGLVGSHLLATLVKEELPIKALYRTEAKKEYVRHIFNYHHPQEGDSLFSVIQWIQCTLEDVPGLTDAFNDVTHVYHCAALISFDPADYKELRKTNIEGTANIVNICIQKKVQKLCYISSIATLNKGAENTNINESSEWNSEEPHSVYAITKYGAEMEVWRGNKEGLDTVIVNPGIIIGPGFYDSGSGLLFSKIHRGLSYHTPGITGYVAVSDVVKITHRLMKGNYSDERYILVSENNSYKTVFTLIAHALHKKPPHKKASVFLMKTGYYLQLIGYRLFRTKRSIFRSSIKSAFSETFYENEKIKKELTYSFEKIEASITEAANFFLKEKNKSRIQK